MYAATACPTCASLRAAAVRLVGEHGQVGLSQTALGAATGLTDAEVADHYPNPFACLYAAYDELSDDVELDVADALDCSDDWHEALAEVSARMLTRLSENPAEARLLFVEALRGDRELRRHREERRQRMVALFLADHRRRDEPEELSAIQFEMLLGASFQLIAAHVSDGRTEDLPELAPELSELAGMFESLAAAA